MPVVASGQHETETLNAQCVLTAVASPNGAGSIVLLASGVPSTVTPIAAGETKTLGPFARSKQYRVVCDNGSVTYGQELVDYPTVDEAVAAASAADWTIVGTIGDLCEIIGEGVPVDYTDGDPAATGEGVAGPGSRYTDITNAALYLNTGTKAEPIWTQLAPVA